MCCFSGPVEHVAGTRIFARDLAEGRQALAYQMNFAAAGSLAMILPLPVPPAPADDAVRFIDLQRYPKLFDDLARAFPVPDLEMSRGSALFALPQSARPTLAVHSVGDFEASFVPTLADFTRLDARFRLAPEVWERLPRYRDWGFAVFKLKREAPGFFRRLLARGPTAQQVHPMAFSFPRRDPRTLFFPTVHVHDGQVHDKAEFDHTLFCQPSADVEQTFGWQASDGCLSRWVDVERSAGLIDGERPCYKRTFNGKLPNRDVELTPPALSDRARLRYRDDVFELTIQARSAYSFEPYDARSRAWQRTARELESVCEQLTGRMSRLIHARAESWGLSACDPKLSEYTAQNGRLYSRTFIGSDGIPLAPADGPLRVRYELCTDRIEPQVIVVGFSAPPSAERVTEIERALLAELEQLRLPA